MNTPTESAILAARSLAPAYVLDIADRGIPAHAQAAEEDLLRTARVIDEVTRLPALCELAELVARLNPKAGEIGDGMLANLVQLAGRGRIPAHLRTHPEAVAVVRMMPVSEFDRLRAIETAARHLRESVDAYSANSSSVTATFAMLDANAKVARALEARA